MKPTFGSLFAGIGGFDLGMEQSGWECKFQVEWDKHCRSILDRHWSTVEKWSDICNVDGRFLPPVDCIVFGSPCQDLSHAGQRQGLSGERSGLFHEAIRIIKEMRNATGGTFPRYTIWENVAGALSSNNGLDFATVINEMVEAGACLQEYALLDAQYFGVPQRRRRIFLVSVFDPATAERCPEPLLPVTESVQGDTKKGRTQKEVIATTLEESTRTNSQWAAGTTVDGDILRTSVTSKWHKGTSGPSGQEFYNMVVENLEWWDGGQIADSLTTTSDQQRMPEKKRLQAVIETKDIIGALCARDYKGVGNQYIDENKLVTESAMAVRRLTPLECERLQGFPDNHTLYNADGTVQADTHRYKQCGNAVAVPVAKWVGQKLMNVHRAAYPATPITHN